MFRKWFKSKSIEKQPSEPLHCVVNDNQNTDPFNFIHSGVVEYFRRHTGQNLNIDPETRKTIGELVAQSYINAHNVQTSVNSLSPYLDMSDEEIETFLRTEYSKAFQVANHAVYTEAGVEKVRYLAIIDNQTCPECRSRHNKVYPLSQVPKIPCHDGCRCTTVAEF